MLSDQQPETLVHRQGTALPPPVPKSQGSHLWPLPEDGAKRSAAPKEQLVTNVYFGSDVCISLIGFLFYSAALTYNLITSKAAAL